MSAIPPILHDYTIIEVDLQTEHLGWHAPDCRSEGLGSVIRKLAGQVKRTLTVCATDVECKKRDGGALRAVGSQLAALNSKRTRILETYYDGIISKNDRDAALAQIDARRHALEHIAPLPLPEQPTPERVMDAVAVFTEWSLLSRDHKRDLLQRLIPEIYVYQFDVRGLTLRLRSNNDSPSTMGR